MAKYSDDDPATKRQYIKDFCKRMLKTQLFLGTFQEKRWVDTVNSYRDVIRIDQDEKEFIENVLAVRKKVRSEFSGDPNPMWIGITSSDMIGAPIGNNLWVTLPIDIFGTYWFKVKTVEFLSCEVKLRLEVVRPIRNEKSAADLSTAGETSNTSFDLKSSIHDISKTAKEGIAHILRNITLNNIKQTVIFIFLLISTIFTGAVSLVQYFMEYLLKFMHETSGIIKVSTPVIIAFINLIWRVIFGFYSLIVALFVHGRRTNINPPQQIYYMPSNDNFVRRKALPYKSSVVISPLDD